MAVISNRGVRNRCIDITKAIGIILVLLAHAINKDNVLWGSINQFHMPLFFMISGYLYSCKGRHKTFILKKIRDLYVPLIVASLTMYFIFILIGQESFSIVECIKILLMHRKGPLLGATWFIQVLFWALIIYDCLNRALRQKIVFIVSLLLLFVGVNVTLPLRISNVMVAVGFVAIGNMSKKQDANVPVLLFVPCFTVVYIASLFTKVSVSTNSYTVPLLFILVALVGSIGTISISKLILKVPNIVKPLRWLGSNTIGIVIWQFVSFKIVSVFQIMIYGLEWSRIWDFPVIYNYASVGWVILDVIVGIVVSIGIYAIQNQLTTLVDKQLNRVKEIILS